MTVVLMLKWTISESAAAAAGQHDITNDASGEQTTVLWSVDHANSDTQYIHQRRVRVVCISHDIVQQCYNCMASPDSRSQCELASYAACESEQDIYSFLSVYAYLTTIFDTRTCEGRLQLDWQYVLKLNSQPGATPQRAVVARRTVDP